MVMERRNILSDTKVQESMLGMFVVGGPHLSFGSSCSPVEALRFGITYNACGVKACGDFDGDAQVLSCE